MMRRRLIDLVVALYPTPIRQRYGEEVADLLDGSPRPWRDLADVGRTALVDRVTTLSWPAVRPHLGRFAWLVFAPSGFGLATVLVLVGPGTLFAVLDEHAGIIVDGQVVDLVNAACVAAVAAEVVWFGRRVARARTVIAP